MGRRFGRGFPIRPKIAGTHRTPPPQGVPSELVIVGFSHNHASIQWNDGVPNETEYRIERSPAGAGTWVEVATQPAVAPGSAAQFTRANSEYLSIADNPSLSMGGDTSFAIELDVRLDSLPLSNNYGLLGKYASGSRGYLLYVQQHAGGLCTFKWLCRKADNSAEVTVTASSFGVISTGVWSHLSVWHDAAANQIGIRVNDAFQDTAGFSDGGVLNDTAEFQMGHYVALAASHFDGRLDSVAIWKRLLTATEKTWRHNGGAARSYEDIGIAGTDGEDLLANLVDWWDLDEESGDRVGKHAGLILTDNNTVTSAEGIAAPTSTRTYDDSGLSPSTSYDYRVRAFNPGGFSAYSNTATVTTEAVPATPSGPVLVKREADRVLFTLEDRAVDLNDDWLLQTIANGGFGPGTAKVPERVVRRWPSSVQQGATLRAYLDSGEPVYEGVMDVDPTFSDGWAEIGTRGAAQAAEEDDSPLVYQDMETGAWVDENTGPHNGSGHQGISVRSEEGALIFEVPAGTTLANGDSHGLARWIPGTSFKKFRCILAWQGTKTNLTLKLERATGPDGSRTAVETHTFGASQPETWETATFSGGSDQLVLSLAATGAVTTPFQVQVRLARASGITDADSFSPAHVVQDVGRRHGWNVNAIDAGVPTRGEQVIVGYVFTAFSPGTYYRPIAGLTTPGGMFKPIYGWRTVASSAMNVLPLAWFEAHSGLLDYMALLQDWRWLVWENGGYGNRLEFGPWGPITRAFASDGPPPRLSPRPRADRVIVRYRSPSGAPQFVEAKPDVNTLAKFGKAVPFIVDLQDPQADADLANDVAENLRNEVAALSYSGSWDLVRGWRGPGRISKYLVRAGGLLHGGDWREGEEVVLRISHTEMRHDGVRLGVNAPATQSMVLAQEQFQRRRGNLGFANPNPFRKHTGAVARPTAGRK